MNANVILARCAASAKLFGMRVEQRGDDWVRTWAFAIDEERAKHEGFDKTEILGTLEPADKYPGCPYCKNVFLLQCTCGKMICCEPQSSDSEEFSVCCDWCGAVANGMEFIDKHSVNSGEY
jgi:hypothetical protein